MSTTNNPLLLAHGIPPFELIQPEHVVPGVRESIKRLTKKLEAIEQNSEPSWDGLLKPLEELHTEFEYGWSPVEHLLSVMNNDELREVHQEVLSEVVEFSLKMMQSEPVYQGLVAIKNSPLWDQLDRAQQRIIDNKIKAVEHSGIALKGESRDRFLEIERELSQLSTDFSNHVLDATKAFELIIDDPTLTEGWPTTLKQVASQSYNQNKSEDAAEATAENGPWRITLDFPSFGPFLQHHRGRDQRELVYDAFVTRAASGDYDNTELMDRILALRCEKAKLLDFETFADLSLDSKMAPSVDAVAQMSDELAAAARPGAERDLQELQTLAKEMGQPEELAHWDIAFYAERLREKRFGFTDEQLRPYFPLDRVLDGLFGLCNWLFGITVKPAKEGEAPTWHEDVRYYHVYNDKDEHVASFYLDPYSRPGQKRNGAWMNMCLGRRWRDGKLVLPVVYLVCNGTPPVGETPSLMSFGEVTTLFHEFGHGLQAMLTTVDYADAAGINCVEWDAVELASQFMENWCYHKPTLIGMTKHIETGEPLPDDLFDKLVSARMFRAGSAFIRQLEFGVTDMTLHTTYVPDNGKAIHEVALDICKQLNPMPPYQGSRFINGFSHIFAGGYSAGYYSYKWSEVLSADAFGAFEEAGLADDSKMKEMGRKYRDTVLAMGGGEEPMVIYKDFRGRAPSTEALLRHNGLA